MKMIMALLFTGLLCVLAAGCAAESPAPAATPKPSPSVTPGQIETSTPSTAPAAIEPEYFYHPPENAPQQAEIRVYKAERTLELWLDGAIAGRFPIGLGTNPEGDKEKQGDGRTPTGAYYVCTRNDRSRYYLSLGVSYPNTGDARRGLESGLIDEAIYERIASAEEAGQRPDWDTALGGEICIHAGGATDWTWGCVATEVETMDILWEYCPIGTPIWIYE
jgi:hypothetical protein